MDKKLVNKVIQILKTNFEDRKECLYDEGFRLIAEQIIMTIEKEKNEKTH